MTAEQENGKRVEAHRLVHRRRRSLLEKSPGHRHGGLRLAQGVVGTANGRHSGLP